MTKTTTNTTPETKGRPLRIQPKLAVGAVNSPEEKEADAVAEKVMRMPAVASAGMTGNAGGGAGMNAGSGGIIQQKAIGTIHRKPKSARIQRKNKPSTRSGGVHSSIGNHAYSPIGIQRKCEHCAQEENKIQRISTKAPPAEGENSSQKINRKSSIETSETDMKGGRGPPEKIQR